MAGSASSAPPHFAASDFSEDLLRERTATVAVCIPVLDEAPTIGAIVDVLREMREGSLIDDVVVADAASADGSAALATARGARTLDQSSLLPEFGSVRGKGDGIWRALSAIESDITCFVDGDLRNFRRESVIGLVGPLISGDGIEFAKAAFRRASCTDDGNAPDEGGRVTESMGRPLLEAFYPRLTGFRQPLSGQFAARTSLLKSVPVSTGYGVDIGLLVDVFERVGLGAMAEVDIGELFNASQALDDLELMSAEVLQAIARRLRRGGQLYGDVVSTYLPPAAEAPVDIRGQERPPLERLTLRGRAA